MAKSPNHLFLDLSSKRRAFVCGDIHGEYPLVREELTKHQFDEDQDVLICVGDLADRGPASEEALEYIDKQWFYYTLGNHERIVRKYLKGEWSRQDIEERFGGAWFTQLSETALRQIADKFENAPFSITVQTPGGRKVGIVHADCMRNWDDQISFLDKVWVQDLSTESRMVINDLNKKQKQGIPFDPSEVQIANIDHVFSGHAVVATPFTCANRSWIDTGACFGGALTVWDVDAFMNSKQGA